jgi:phosphonate transport system permease protein
MADPGARTLPPLPAKPRGLFPVWLAACLALAWLAAWDLELSPGALLDGVDDMAEYAGRYGTPDFTDLPRYLVLAGQTLATAFWGTVLAVVIAFLVAPLAARPLTSGRVGYRIARELLNAIRAVPDMLLALVFVAALGLGPLPGALALGVHTGGFLGKFCAESMERVDGGLYEALAATGASRAQSTMFVAWPSIVREVVGYALFIFDRNVRMASVLGLVGAGGLGLALHDTLRLFDYGRSAALIIVLIGTIAAIDVLSSWLRGRLTRGGSGA